MLEIVGSVDSAADSDGLRRVSIERKARALKLRDLAGKDESAESLLGQPSLPRECQGYEPRQVDFSLRWCMRRSAQFCRGVAYLFRG